MSFTGTQQQQFFCSCLFLLFLLFTFFAIFIGSIMDILLINYSFLLIQPYVLLNVFIFFQSHHIEEIIINDERFETAEKMVKEFLASRIVYRRFNKPIGWIKVNDDQPYTIRGYFIPAQSTGYQFITYNPIKQFYEITSVSF